MNAAARNDANGRLWDLKARHNYVCQCPIDAANDGRAGLPVLVGQFNRGEPLLEELQGHLARIIEAWCRPPPPGGEQGCIMLGALPLKGWENKNRFGRGRP